MKDDFDTVRAVEGVKKETHTQLEDHGEENKDRTDDVRMDMDNGDTAQDVSDDDFGSSGVEDLLASKVKVASPAPRPSAAKALLPPKHSVQEEKQSSQDSHQQSFLSHSKPFASSKQKSVSSSPREPDSKQNTADTQAVGGKPSSPLLDDNKRTTKSKNESALATEVLGIRAPHKEGLRCGLSGVVLSDEESAVQDYPASPHSLEELDDRVSVTSTETEESAHINAGLKDSLLAPLSTMPEASNVGQLQDLVRELRLKLEKEFGRRVDLEARVSGFKQQEKQARLLCSQQELSSQQMQQEISSLMARVKQLEYQGRTEQDSSLLQEHTLQDAQQRCGQLEEQCGALQVHAQQQEQLMNSLMVQLQTKERINLTLQDKLEEVSSQTKFVSMKSCQTEDFLMAIAPQHKTVAVSDRGTQCARVGMMHASCQNTPQRVYKSSQTQFITKSSFSQTDIQGFSQDIKSVLKSSEDCHLSAVEDISRGLSNQIQTLASSLSPEPQHPMESHSHERLLQVQEGISQLQDTLQTQMEAVKELSSEPSQVELQNLHQTVERVNVDLKSDLDNLESRLSEALQNYASNHHEQKVLITSLVEQKHEDNKILTNISGQLDERSGNDTERYLDLKQHIAAQLSEIKRAIESSSMSDDSGVSGNLTKGVVERLDSIEKSLVVPSGRGCVSEELSGVQGGVQQLSYDLHNRISTLEELIRAVNSDSKHDQTALMEQTKAIGDSNDHITTLVNLRLSEANSDLSEAIEENFRIVQDHMHHLQQAVVQRINEVAEHISVSEDKKGSNLTRQIMEIVSQVSGVHGDLAQLQSSVEQARSTPSAAGMADEALVSSLKTCHEQASESLKCQTDIIIKQLETLQKEIHNNLTQGQNAREQHEVQFLKKTFKEKESEMAAVQAAREQLQDKLNQQNVSLASLQGKEEEWKMKKETLQEKVHDLTVSLKDKDQAVRQEAAKSAALGEDTVKLRQENFRLSSEHAKLSALLEAERQQRQWCEGRCRGLGKLRM
ncbi:hypothetical protein GWK47_029149 [Chionoecetes opilio]|uniref:Uncharacterized protein n=1 Tax=Chionoecetes opilio TaxID=41210 RepID=A0A8J4YN96_CHIOP|nr:hypothetical protein GWK47_029149 [Chionoecetes opilio]